MKQAVRRFARATRRHLVRISNRLEGYDPVGHGTVPRSLHICEDVDCRVCNKIVENKSKLRIVYILPSDNSPTGGHKVSYQQCEIISNHGVDCFAFHAEKPAASYTWFSHNVKTLKTGHFDPQSDFLIFSEGWAAVAATFCIPAGLRYAIFVQNGYLTHEAAGFAESVVCQAYEHASLVLSISSDTSAVISLAYPHVPPEKIIRIRHSVSPLFAPGPKQQLLTYMPRKLRAHAERLRLYLRNALPHEWQMLAIENLDERGVAAVLSRSSIFLSLSELEGCPLPPIEAALSGNIVVGYSGQGAKEYFVRPIFREVQNGDFLRFVAEVQIAVDDAEHGFSQHAAFMAQSSLLAKTHSRANEVAHVMNFVAKVRQIMGLD
jgi:hypothetical protein